MDYSQQKTNTTTADGRHLSEKLFWPGLIAAVVVLAWIGEVLHRGLHGG
ncbi:hypothetical protein [Paraburkholderia kururiensis]|uniref:Uncharacterized protein n=1 Tax=Paraburkholderia kururiensis TaxID=984307 RepID=A0ABZ0WVJ0_9BURK|nr:hypothetical protein [Paraburkholderia kururiensis]WQD81265.1 hypothetical protein U0042_29780 [Paraburkholderia kururiensis]